MNDPYTTASEYLKDFITHVLEAFQSGNGITGGTPEPITMDIALRQIWHEIQHVLSILRDRAGHDSSPIAYLRIDAPDADTLLKALDTSVWASTRFMGPRRPGDRAVAYVTTSAAHLGLVVDIIKKLQHDGCNVRDFSYGATFR